MLHSHAHSDPRLGCFIWDVCRGHRGEREEVGAVGYESRRGHLKIKGLSRFERKKTGGMGGMMT